MKKRARAWAVVDEAGVMQRVQLEPIGTVYGFKGERIVELVLRNPAADALIAAVRKIRSPHDCLFGPLERYEASIKKR